MTGHNAMSAMFMVIFGQECYIKFNSVAKEHFFNKPFKIGNNVKSNAIRVW